MNLSHFFEHVNLNFHEMTERDCHLAKECDFEVAIQHAKRFLANIGLFGRLEIQKCQKEDFLA